MRYVYSERGEKLMLDPSLGEAELASREAHVEALNKRSSVWDGIALGPLALGISVIILGPLAGQHAGEGAGWATAGIIVAVAIILFALCRIPYRRAEKESARIVRGWQESGEAIPAGLLRKFAESPDIDDATRFRAAQIVQSADELKDRVKWAVKAKPEGRLPTGAHDTLAEVEDLSRHELYQRAADMLDPNGAHTSAWLRGDVA